VPQPKTLTGARQALAFARRELTDGPVVDVPADFGVKALRCKLGRSQVRRELRLPHGAAGAVRTLKDAACYRRIGVHGSSTDGF
jgi:hypothetical protein